VEHIVYAVSGTLHACHDDGSESEVTPGDVYRIAPGHDAWVVGSERAVVVEFQGAADHATPTSRPDPAAPRHGAAR
jgi:quercetin dioxygenase-like cupin family protein